MQKNKIANASVFDAVRNYTNKRESENIKHGMGSGLNN